MRFYKVTYRHGTATKVIGGLTEQQAQHTADNLRVKGMKSIQITTYVEGR